MRELLKTILLGIAGLAFISIPDVGQAAPQVTGLATLAEMSMPDCDGLAVGDIDNDGDLDLLVSASQLGHVYWLEQQDTPTRWKRHTVFKAKYDNPKIEGNALGDFDSDGQLEAISLDQRAAKILVHDAVPSGSGGWRTSTIQSDRQLLQDALTADIADDGRPELIYTWEGKRRGRGGVHALALTGGRPLEPRHWTDHELVQHESAWWLAPALIPDANGEPTILFTARHQLERNPGSRPGLFQLRRDDRDRETWNERAIDQSLNHPLHVDIGNLSGNEATADAVVGGLETRHIHWYDRDEDWKRHRLKVPAFSDNPVSHIWNVETVPVKWASRDLILAVVEAKQQSAIFTFQWRDGRYHPRLLKRLNYGHAMEDRIVCRDLTDDGQVELIIADSGGDRVRIFELRINR
jgi:hypothetical protein